MKYLIHSLLFLSLLVSCAPDQNTVETIVVPSGPISLHPENPHYFLYNGETRALITSGEHYGAVLNLDFDYKTYLNTLSEEGMNYTRIFSGSYFEIYGQSFGIKNNSLAPKKNRVITPWGIVVNDVSGNYKYDLSEWNTAYFERLKDFMKMAAEKDIIVEVTLFSSIYNEGHWNINPQNPQNNVNIHENLSYHDAQTLNNGKLLGFQEAFVKKMVRELNSFDNFFFEIQNEPWADHSVSVYNILNKEELVKNDWTYKVDFPNQASLGWNSHIAKVIKNEESDLPKKHLIAMNYCNFKAPIPEADSNFSILNFHYAWPEAVEWNYHYDKVIGFDESGFAGSEDIVYRRQAWQFMLSGGGLFNNLDYSFYPGSETGTGKNTAPGGGSLNLRSQLRVLSEFLHSFELHQLYPDHESILSSPGLIPYVLSDRNKSWAIYLRSVGTKNVELKLSTGKGKFAVQTLNTLNGEYSSPVIFEATEGSITIEAEIPDGELALKITRKD